ncbi:MAG: ATP-binding protein [Candidatus Brocadiia bacterium]
MSPTRASRGARGRADQCALRLPADTGYLAAVRELVASAARRLGLAMPEVAKTVMAVDEACVNVVQHGYRGQRRGILEVAVEVEATRLTVTIADRSPAPFSPLEHPAPDLEAYWAAPSRPGLGILILRQFMDHVSHTYLPGQGNRLRLVKYAAGKAPSATAP